MKYLFFSWSKDNKKNYKWIKKIDPDWSVGWSYLIRGDILKKYKNKIIGYHPSDLQKIGADTH